jgi:hypothetical protein
VAALDLIAPHNSRRELQNLRLTAAARRVPFHRISYPDGGPEGILNVSDGAIHALKSSDSQEIA